MQAFALKFRPKNLDEICGQAEVVAVFKKFIANGKIPHSIFYGVAGCGKTSFARAVAGQMDYDFYEFDGGNLKIDDFRKILKNHENALTKPLFFIDEIHRLSKTQQETLLIPMENYHALVIGASTENPYFTLSSGIRSRSMLFEFKPLNVSDFEKLLTNIRTKVSFEITDEAKDYLFKSSGGDARALLNLLEFTLSITTNITLTELKTLRANALSDGVSSDDTHYNLASAFIKSLRGSDTDAVIYYLARLIDGGESADFIARRMVIFASEDIGNANPNALTMATNTLTAVSKIGYPEARIILAQCAVYLANSPKSNSSYKAINVALSYVKNEPKLQVPKYLINSDPEIKKYLYPHDFGGWVEQTYLEKPLKFYDSNGIGFEKTLDEWSVRIKTKK
ncbi:replication-associated recombination protein A [Campylobacter sp. faydin G-24]|uniref:Replication-associated recombination protein A n=1 Tax=Campylobacter anatolicus TaxID=2829105 RepID=A0ABS5HKW2_9BACT|nr:replication-associated recombination protein A [Campylobacter anatolicus]MBR8461410.1 replication-associated recombination protein A [Campylobacter anatolicus]MBR8464227.1 replication-associated recombination protein A [Campylobacter anatolicus]MBR8466132.1 replication-associated recombination protein A [Campylobacter anatolicus]